MTHSYDFYKKHYYFWLFLPIVMSLVLIDSFDHTKNIDNKHNRYNQPSFLSTIFIYVENLLFRTPPIRFVRFSPAPPIGQNQ